MNTLRLAFRQLGHAPGFTLVALITLGLGIGINTSMVSIVNALLFRSGPFPEPQRLVQIVGTTPQGEARAFSEVELGEIRAQAAGFASLTTIGRTNFAVAEPGQPAERLAGVLASADLFSTLGVPPIIGRAFTAEETQPGRNGVIVLSHGFWRQRFGGRADVLGQTLRLDGETVTIIGVMPPSFDYRMLWGGTDFWRPINFTQEQITWRDYRMFQLLGRLAPGVQPGQAAAALAPVAAAQEKEHPDSYTGFRYRVLPLNEALMDTVGRKISWMLLGLSGFVLLIVCANLANLQLSRAVAASRELGIRAALGASRARLVLHQLVASVLLAVLGGIAGLLVARGLNTIAEHSFLIDGAPGDRIPLDTPVLVCACVVALLTGILFGIMPAWIGSRVDIAAALKAQSRSTTADRSHHRLRQLLIVGQVALALVLLGGAGILLRGLQQFLERESGWDTERVLTAAIPVPGNRFDTDPKRIEFFRRLEERLVRLPGVEHAALATSLPLLSYTGDRQVLTEGQLPGSSAMYPTAFHVMITSDYFAALGIELVAGRLFDPNLKPDSPRVIIITESLARRLWPNASALGQQLTSMDSGLPFRAEIIGVVRDVDTAVSLAPPSTPYVVYKPLVHEPWGWIHVVLRGPAPAALIEPLRRAVAEVDPDLTAEEIGTVRQVVDWQQRNLALAAKTLGGFALLGLLLAAIGLYGVISNLVVQRTNEFGIRLALGAQPGDVLGLVLRHGLRLSLIGLGFGLAGAYALGRFLGGMMPRLAGPDPFALAGVSLLLFVVALLACWLPARRATKVDPLVALRAE